MVLLHVFLVVVYLLIYLFYLGLAQQGNVVSPALIAGSPPDEYYLTTVYAMPSTVRFG